MKVVVTGASGWVGSNVAAALRNMGHRVTEFQRSPTSREAVQFDLSDRDGSSHWPELLKGHDAIVHCAAHVHRAESGYDCERFRMVNAVGTFHLINACEIAGVRRFVLVSTIAVYDWERAIGPAVEDNSPLPRSEYGKSKLAAENALRRSRLDWRIARLGTVYGIGDRANFARMAIAMSRGRFLIPGNGRARKSLIPVDVAATLLAELVVRDEIRFRMLNIALPCAPSLAEICDAYSRLCGFRRVRRFPLGPLKMFAKAGDVLSRVYEPWPLTSDIVVKLTTQTEVDVSRMCQVWADRRWPKFQESLARSAGYYRQLAKTR